MSVIEESRKSTKKALTNSIDFHYKYVNELSDEFKKILNKKFLFRKDKEKIIGLARKIAREYSKMNELIYVVRLLNNGKEIL